MLALLFAIALIAVPLLVLALAGVLAAVVTGVALLNAFALILGLAARRQSRHQPIESPPWRPSSFRTPPELPDESEEHLPSLTIHRR
jgi:hypothetical protein